MSQYVNQREIRVIGMSRSGNHAIIQWIAAQAPGRVCFLNCTEGKSNPFTSARPIEGDRVHQANFADFDLEGEQKGVFSPKDYLIFSHEDSFLGHACSRIFEMHHDCFVGPSARRFDVLVLRDPFNLFASRTKLQQSIISTHTAARIWKQHAREFLGLTQRLRHQPVLISYNRWFTDADYRRTIAEQLGLDFTDSRLQSVAVTDGGSSFDGLRFDGKASQMKVLERWKHFTDAPWFQAIFDEEMASLSERIFGPIPGTEKLLPAPMKNAAD